MQSEDANLWKRNISQTNSLFTNLIAIHSPVLVDVMGVSLMLTHNLRSRFLKVAIMM